MEINQIKSGTSIIGGGKIQSNMPNQLADNNNNNNNSSNRNNTRSGKSTPSKESPNILRSPQIQSFLNSKSREEKYVTCAPLMRCKEKMDPTQSRAPPRNMRRVDSHIVDDMCICEGYKLSPQQKFENLIVAFQDEPCASCHHKLTSHGNLDLMDLDELNLCTHLCIQINFHQDEAKKTSDPQKKQRHQNVIAKLKMAIQNSSVTRVVENSKEQADLGLPPFEQPTIAQILQNFLDLRSTNSRRSVSQVTNDQSAILHLMSSLDQHQIEPAEASSNPNFETGFNIIYSRWKFYCANSALPQNYKITEIFGKSVLRMILSPVSQKIEATNAWPPDLAQSASILVSDLEKEVMNDRSQIFDSVTVKPQEIQQYITAASREKKKIEPVSVKRLKLEPEPKIKVPPTNYAPVPFEPTEDYLKEINEKLGNEEREQKSRDQKARAEERRGIIHFRVIRNDGKTENLIWLANLKNIFAKQLPKMPVDYIVRLVFDRNHRSLLLLRSTTVLGGITFRPFLDQKFIEIAFCAVTSSEQVKGYGTHLMNHLKDAVQPEALTTFLTYADNYAIGYFRKQGFDKKITFPAEKWKGRIKDYDGGTLMQCQISMDVPYLKIPEMVSNQRKIITDKVSELTSGHVQHTGIDWSKGGPINIMDIPGIRETGLQYKPLSLEDRKKLQGQMEVLMEALLTHHAAWPFLKPVSKKEVPDYYEIVKDPIDLESIQKRLQSRTYYITKELFLSDIRRICENCKMYNREETEYHKCALEIENEFVAGASKYFEEHENIEIN